MLKSTQEGLEVKNSNNQTGTVHQTDYCKEIEESIQAALNLQKRIYDLFEMPFIADLFNNEIRRTEQCTIEILEDLAPIMGYAVINAKRDTNNG
ncbi:hypothetical protein [Bacteroides sp. An269]|uniref:hypothetical protein n=1 Tax=Bacteroides sp. An269 TaxID=1965613 RepID=UPI000B369C7A|nr:hypothetical protein [Bacteroides sp. An269]OUO85320.1 hypothetical protein B5F71_00805 [Bacteroides sp. An269]